MNAVMKTNAMKGLGLTLALLAAFAAHAGFVDSRAPEPPPKAEEPEAKSNTPTEESGAEERPQTVTLEAGKRLDDELRKVLPADWSIDAVPYLLGQSIVVPNDFEAAVVQLMQAANAAGVRLRARFYHGNKIIRIVEY